MLHCTVLLYCKSLKIIHFTHLIIKQKIFKLKYKTFLFKKIYNSSLFLYNPWYFFLSFTFSIYLYSLSIYLSIYQSNYLSIKAFSPLFILYIILFSLSLLWTIRPCYKYISLFQVISSSTGKKFPSYIRQIWVAFRIHQR